MIDADNIGKRLGAQLSLAKKHLYEILYLYQSVTIGHLFNFG